MSAGCACPYHDAPCANGATATTERYEPLCGQCRAHLAEAWRGMYRVSKLLGHASIHTTELYASFDADSETAGDDIEKALSAGA